MDLHHESRGDGPPLIILHGLLGAGENWRSTAGWLAGRYRVYVPDLRNHGRSPHADRMDYPAMADDLRKFMERHSIRRAVLLGHSMGGKVAMWFSLTRPELVAKLVVVDMAPRPYGDRHGRILEALASLEPERFGERGEIEPVLRSTVPDQAMRLFLLKNLVRREEGGFAWRINLAAIVRHYDKISGWPETGRRCLAPTLFLKGERSDYLLESDGELISHYFPASRLVTIAQAGHWPHVEEPGRFRRALEQFLGSIR